MERKFKVLFITPAYPPTRAGGSEISLQMLAEGLEKKGLDIVIVSSDGSSKKEQFEILNNIRIIRIKKSKIIPNTLAHILTIIKNKGLIQKENPEIIHVYNTWQIPAASIFKKKSKVVATLNNYFPVCPIAYTIDNLMEKEKFTFIKMFKSIYKTMRYKNIGVKSSFFRSMFYTLYWKPVYYFSKDIDLFIPVSKTTGKIYAIQGFPQEKIKPIYNIIDKNKYPKLEFKINRKKNNLLYVGGVSEAKGIKDLVEALIYVKNKNLVLDLVGKGPILEEIKEISKKNNLNIRFKGYLDHEKIKDFYLTSSLLVHTSVWPDPFPRVFIESLYFNIPVLTSDHPVAKEVFGKNAVYYKRGDAKDLARKLDLITSGKLKQNLKGVRKKMFSQRPIDEIYKSYLKLLEQT